MKIIRLFRRSLLICSLLFMGSFSFSQVTEKWVKRQTGDYNAFDEANDLVIDHKGNVYVTGASEGKGSGTDYVTIKYDDDGDIKWVKKFNGPGNSNDQANTIAVDHKGNVYVTGWSTGNGTGSDFTTIKYDDDGDTKWVKSYNGPGNSNDEAVALAIDDDGNVYVTGAGTGEGTGFDYVTIKYDKNGNTKWVRRYNGPGNDFDRPAALAVDDNGNVYITGGSTGIGTGLDYTTIKYDDDGHLKWVKQYNGPLNSLDRANALALDGKGNVYVTGFISTLSDEEGNLSDIVTIKYNTSGRQQWATVSDGRARDEANALVLDAAGNVYITGLSRTVELDPDHDFVTIKYNTAGVQQWLQLFISPGYEQAGGANDLVLDEAGNVYVTGGLSVKNELDYATLKYNNNGVLQWAVTHDGIANYRDNANAIGIDHNGNIYITGQSEYDYYTIKYNLNGVQKKALRYDGPGDRLPGGIDMANALAVDREGHVHVTGGITRNNVDVDFTTYKYDNDGDREWKKTFNGPGNDADEAKAIVLDSKGNVYITGRSEGSGTGDDFVTIKYDRDGNKKWSERYNGGGNSMDQPTGITVDEEGNVFVTGASRDSNSYYGDYVTIRYDKDGNKKWVRRYNGPDNSIEVPYAIAVDRQSNVYVTGTGIDDYVTLKYDVNGNELWVATYNGPGNSFDGAVALVLDASGNVYVTGSSYGTGTSTDYATIKYNAAGVRLWVARYNGQSSSFDNATDIGLDASGNVYVTGSSLADYATIKYNSNGAQQWVVRYNGGYDEAGAMAVDSAGNVYVTGSSILNYSTGQDYATVKYNATGERQWVARYNGPGQNNDIPTGIALDNKGNVFVTGRSIGNGTSMDYATIKYEQTPPVTTNSSSYAELNNLIVVYRHTNGGDIPDNYATLLNAAIDETNLFYWRHSHMRLNIKWTVYVINDNLPRVRENGYVYPHEVDADLRSRGFTTGSYDAVVAVVSGGGAYAWGVNRVLGKGGYCQVPWYEDKLLFPWFIVHEFHHVVDAMFHDSGHPEYPHNHPGAARTLGEFVPHTGSDWDLNAAILQYWKRPDWLHIATIGIWGTIKTFTDNDRDSIPDKDTNIPLDEQRFGSSSSRIDTDGDGLTDLQEAMAGIFMRTNPANTDFDKDGIPDGSDAEPVYPLNTTVPSVGNLSLTQDVTSWPLAGHYYFDKPDAASSSLHLAYSENNLFIGVKIPSGIRTFLVFIDANNDGLFYGSDNIQLRLVGNTVTEVSLFDAAAVPAGNPDDFIVSPLPVTGFSGITKSGAGWSSYQFMIPRLSQYGLNLSAGDSVGIYLLAEGYGSLFEPNDLLTVRLQENANRLIAGTENKAGEKPQNKDHIPAKLNAKAFPNAFSRFINLQWSGSDKPVTITITDALGRLVEKRTNLAGNGTIKTGDNFSRGVYYVELVQGSEKTLMRIIKN
jgi:uncharacterized delta-60 repeat protein